MAKKENTEGCSCISEVSELLREQVKETESKKSKKKISKIEGRFERLSIYPKTKLYAIFKAEVSFKPEKGKAPKRPKNVLTNVMFSFCPFCGKEYNTDEKK